MTLSTGTRLGPYEITARLGEGGMGEVYRATDSRLKRDVAIKVLPAAFTADRERLLRFEREAQLLAQLHHPNIASIFGLEEQDGVRALVMELVEGEDLAQMLARGPLPVDEALSIARQIAEALEAAHEQGIVHRDLKPANVKVRPDGAVKVLDFGLAKAMDAGGSSAGGGAPSAGGALASPALMNSPTLTHAATQLGVILGTAAYMAPEQARGKAVDKRADVWAFGVVLYEMLTGRRLFAGEEASDVLAAVLRQEIELAALPAATPPRVRQLLGRCLERDPRARLRDIGEARVALEDLRHGRAGVEVAPRATAPRTLSPALLAALALVVVALAAGWLLGRRTMASREGGSAASDGGFHRFTHLTYQSGMESSPCVSPDGELIAFTAIDGGDRDIFLLRTGGERTINLTADAPADDDHAAFSPDGRSLAFRSERGGGGIFVMGATGESVRRLTDFGDNPAWSPDGRTIVFATEGASDPHAREKTSELWVVPMAGGAPRRLFAGDAMQPSWSPGGHRIAYWAVDEGIRDVWTMAADGTDPQRVTNLPSVDWDPVWSHDGTHLYFESDRGGAMNPWRVAIDERTGKLLGAPEPITVPSAWTGQISLAADERRLVYRTSEMSAEVRRLPFDAVAGTLTGPAERLFDTVIPAVGLDVAADGTMLFRTAAMQEDVYVMQADGSGLRKLTDDQAKDRNPEWSPDGSQAVFYSNRGGRYEIWTVDRDGSNLRQRTLTTGRHSSGLTAFAVWAPDGRSMVADISDHVWRFPVRDAPVPHGEMTDLAWGCGEGARVLPLSWSPDGQRIAGVCTGRNGQLLGGVTVHDLASATTRFVAIDLPVPPARHIYPILSWLPDSRRGVVRWGDRLLLVDTTTGASTTLLAGFHRDGGTARVSHDGHWLYMLDSRDEGDLWMASRDESPAAAGAAAAAATTGAPR